ncbi:permease [Thermocrinis jamiesonii]|jgi:Predicted permeases|uniref:permease n=1 Tax=Thermocrinis jamiesonii TaxID=1302351 RepID=UPI0006892F17|nr:permease [Thermocrinis jamiesonii]
MELLKNFYSYLAEIIPFFILAVFISALLKTTVKPSLFLKILSNRVYAPVLTALLGGVMPLCSCSMIPLANFINSYSKGYGPVIAFLVTAPTLSPVILLLTYGLFGWEVSLYRLFASLFFALSLGLIADYVHKKPITLRLSSHTEKPKKISTFFEGLKDQLPVVKYLLIGIFIASIMKTYIPPQLTASISQSPLVYPLISLVAIPIYVCSGEDVVLGKAILDVGFTTGQAMTFMLSSSGVCLPTIFAVMSFLPKRIVVLYTTGWFLFSIVTGFAYDILFYK